MSEATLEERQVEALEQCASALSTMAEAAVAVAKACDTAAIGQDATTRQAVPLSVGMILVACMQELQKQTALKANVGLPKGVVLR